MILITGGTGMVGHHLLAHLVRGNVDIRALFRSVEKRDKAIERIKAALGEKYAKKADAIQWIKADITDLPALETCFDGIDYVYHCAGLVSFNIRDKDKLRKINIEGTANMVNLALAKGVKKFCHLSSVAALGDEPDGKSITEESPRNNAKFHTYYDISKFGAEVEVWRASQEGLPVVIVNPAIIIGGGNWTSGSGRVFRLVAGGFPFRIARKSGFVGVDDVVSAMCRLMDSPIENQRFLLVGECLEMKAVTQQIAGHLQCRPPKYDLKKWMVYMLWAMQSVGYVFGGKKQITRMGMAEIFTDVAYDSTKLKEAIGFDYTPVKMALKKTAEQYLAEH